MDAQKGPAPPDESEQRSSRLNILSLQALPLFSTFFLWGLGTGAQQLARPLFAADLGASSSLIILLAASNSLAWFFTAPITGLLTDRWGRKPLVMAGNLLRGATMVVQYFVRNYLQFFLMEVIGAVGVAMWITGSSIIMADVSERENRGRAMAVRTLSSRFGGIAGPAAGGILASAFSLKSLFLFGAATKVAIHLVVVFLIRDTRPAAVSRQAREKSAPRQKRDWSVFHSSGFLALALATFALSIMSFAGTFGAIFPLYARDTAGLSVGDVGRMMSLAGIATLLISYPNGMFVDRFGRKKSLVPGMLILGLAAYLLAGIKSYGSVVVMIVVYGIGEGISMGTSEVFAMDLAPESWRGTFLGIWASFRNAGGVIAPGLISLLSGVFGLSSALYVAAGLLGVSALIMALFGLETRARGMRQTGGSAG